MKPKFMTEEELKQIHANHLQNFGKMGRGKQLYLFNAYLKQILEQRVKEKDRKSF